MDKPNIIVVMADDAGVADMGCYNSNSPVPTPNIDKIASEGVKFCNAYSPGTVCTQTRYALLTGQYHFRTDHSGEGVIFDYTDSLLDGKDTIQQYLKRKGYNTYCSGKWHLGIDWSERVGEGDGTFRNDVIDFSSKFEGPTTEGFDKYYGIRASLDHPPYCFLEDNHVVGHPNQEKEVYYNQQRVGPESPVWNDRRVDTRICERALSYITRGYQSNSPFFLYVPTSAPHRPCLPPEFIKGNSGVGAREDMVSMYDWVIGRLTKQLENLGIRENTLLLVTSDHGPKPNPDNDHDPTGGKRGRKGSLYEGGISVPLVASWPNKINQGNIKENVSLIDIFPTIKSIVGSDKRGSLDGESMYSSEVEGFEIDEDQNLVFEDGDGKLAIRMDDWKYIQTNNERNELYNLADDPIESNNLIDEYTNYRDKLVEELKIIT